MRDLVRTLAKEATVIISTHVLQEVQAVCDRVLIIREGRLALDSTMQELNSGRRLLLGIDSKPETAQPVISAVDGVDGVEALAEDNGQYRYAVSSSRDDLDGVAAVLSKALIDKGCRLYSLHAEHRDLETVFGEISTRGEVSHG
jgi:ABC-2 type transport system ATP-binding protein